MVERILKSYNKSMTYTVEEFENIFRTHVGDGTIDIPSDFIIKALNWSFNALPLVPKLGKIFLSTNKSSLMLKATIAGT